MQISLFGGTKKFKITKQIRLIELFGGEGNQSFAMKYLDVDFQQWKLCEWAVKSIQAYKDAHFKDDNIDYSKESTKEQIFEYLSNKGISANYNEPMSYEQIKRLGEDKARQIYNNIKATNNLVNIQQVKGKDLEIVDTNIYEYIMTYSFPCQDLSLAGLGKGMEKGSNTRSGMLWEVERILDELHDNNKELPQVLVMENVPEVHGQNNIQSFASWLAKLESLGYKCYWKDLNAKDYGIPQNRDRCFMVSILGDYYYNFPKSTILKDRLKDLLEKNVDEKYYLSDKMLAYCTDMKDRNGFVRGKRFNPIDIESKDYAYTITTNAGHRATDNFIKIKNKDLPNNVNYRIRKLTPKECFRLMGVKDKDFENIAQNQSNTSLYHLAGDSIVVNVLMAIFKEML